MAKDKDLPQEWRDAADAMNAERIERLIASNEASTNAINRLAQVLERRETKKTTIKVARVRRAVTRTTVVSDRVEAVAKQALARIRSKQ